MIRLKSVLIVFTVIMLYYSSDALSHETSLSIAKVTCSQLKDKLSKIKEINYGYHRVPKYYNSSAKEQIPLFYWKRKGKDLSFPPLVFIHGGVGGNSNFLFDLKGTKRLIDEYPGDFFAFDLRGEGCSKTIPSNLHPSEYRYLSVVNTAKDIEYLRGKGFFGKPKIRLYGQSRGSAIIHHYFSMFPNGVESAHVHGFSIENDRLGRQGVITRAKAYVRAWRRYKSAYPRDENLINKIKTLIRNDECWIGIDNMRICGPESVGVYGISLARTGSYEGIHKAFLGMVNKKGQPEIEKVRAAIGSRWKKTAYKEFNYVVGANGQDIASIGIRGAQSLKNEQHPAYFEAPFSEVRFINEAIQKEYIDDLGQRRNLVNQDWEENYIEIDYNQISRSLIYNKNQKYFLYASLLDPIAPPEMYEYELRQLNGIKNFRFLQLPNGHGDFEFPSVVKKILERHP